MVIVSWNVNGLRSLYAGKHWQWFEKEQPDIFCLQETKAEREQLPPEVAQPAGYHAYFNSSKERKGHSGTALYAKQKPNKVVYDVLPERFNMQGRIIEAFFNDFVLINTYFPNGGGPPERLAYKLDFYDAFFEHLESLRKSRRSIIVCGDVNVAHEDIDLARPKENETHVGFLPEERAWFDEVVRAGYIDTFRYFYPNKTGAYTYWDSYTHARDRNVGWRIDYFLVTPDLLPKIKRSNILTDVFGSDHCPILLDTQL